MRLDVLYFARLREVFGLRQETVLLDDAASLADLLAHLRARGGVWADELAPGRAYRVACNQEIVDEHASVADGDEIAIFPPVTGG